MCGCMYLRMYVCMYVCMYVRMYVCVWGAGWVCVRARSRVSMHVRPTYIQCDVRELRLISYNAKQRTFVLLRKP